MLTYYIWSDSIIYSGILEDYFLSRSSGGLERLIIKYPFKKAFTTEGSSEFREIPGDYLSIPYNQVININIQYYELSEDDNSLKESDDDNAPIVTPFTA